MHKKDYDRVQLISDWRKIYGSIPPKGLSRHTLELAKEYNKQAQKNGRLPKNTIKQLIKIANMGKHEIQPSSLSDLAKPGVRLTYWRAAIFGRRGFINHSQRSPARLREQIGRGRGSLA